VPSSAFSGVFPRPSVSDIGAGLVLYRVWGNTVFWTLVIEARWYLLLPLAVLGMIAIEKRGVNKWIGSATLLLMSGILSLAYLKGINATPGTVRKLAYSIGLVMAYLPILISGVVLARHREFIQLTYKRHHVGISIVLLLVGIGCMTQFPADPTNFTMAKRLLFAGGGALAIFILAMISPIAQRFLEHPFIVHLGKISYTAYLIHLPLIQVFKHIIPSTSMPQPLSFVTYYIVLPIILIAISHYAWHLLEAPFLRKPVRTVTETQT
jgi:peptidoglycan/LPS O-acetylase OafA/YrhL